MDERRREQGRRQAPRQPRADGRSAAPRKKRRHRRSGAAWALLYVVFVIGISALLASLGWMWAGDVLALNKDEHTAVITVSEGETFHEVTNELHENGIIEYKWLFNLFATVTKGKEKLVPGMYELNTEMDYRAIIANLGSKSVSRVEISVTIPEGYTVMQIFKLLEEKGVSTVDKLTEQAASYNYKFSFLQEIPLGDYRRLEGYLFPDTYRFYMGEDPKTVLNKMIANFDRKFTDDMRQQAADMGYSVHDIVNIASMIEKETDGSDQTHIASVIYNRLKGTATNGYLQIDATIQYILPERKEKLTAEDQAIDDPYNTYQYAGLPAGPISNPGIASLRSALNPQNTSDYYYALGDDGVHHFFQTYDAQQRFIQSQALYQNG